MSKIILKTKIKNNSIITENNSLIFNDIITESKIISNYDDIIKKHNDYIRAIFIKNVEKDMNIKKDMNNKSKKNKKLEEQYNFLISIKKKEENEGKELECSALTSSYDKCKQKVNYIYKNMNNKNEKINEKYNVPF